MTPDIYICVPFLHFDSNSVSFHEFVNIPFPDMSLKFHKDQQIDMAHIIKACAGSLMTPRRSGRYFDIILQRVCSLSIVRNILH